MTKAHPLASLKSGDLVLLVEQSHRGRKGKKYWEEVLSIGRKYGYILRRGKEKRFDLNTGQSVHKDGNDRENGFGFDIYLSEEEYDQHSENQTRKKSLQRRIKALHNNRFDYSPEAIADVLAVLDRHGILPPGNPANGVV